MFFRDVNIIYPSYKINHSNTTPYYEDKPKSIFIGLVQKEIQAGYYNH